MKCFIFVVLVAALGVHARAARVPEILPKFERGVRHIVEKMKNGDTDLPLTLPSLLPLKIQPTSTTFRSFTMNISEVEVYGLENLQLDWVRASRPESEVVDLAVSLGISVPATLVARADYYHLGGTLGPFPVDVKGAIRAEVNNFKGVAVVKLAQRQGGTGVVGIELDFFADVEVHMGGAGEVINEVFNTILRDLLADGDSEVFAKAKEVVTSMIEQYLHSYTPAQLIKLVEGAI